MKSNESQTAKIITIAFPDLTSIGSDDEDLDFIVDVPENWGVGVSCLLGHIASASAKAAESEPIGLSIGQRE
jgi:hypothetical protein